MNQVGHYFLFCTVSGVKGHGWLAGSNKFQHVIYHSSQGTKHIQTFFKKIICPLFIVVVVIYRYICVMCRMSILSALAFGVLMSNQCYLAAVNIVQ